ncbi:hypothetical protein [Methylobacterium radiodurans]|uniref:HTH cro/C1-type domain-containing protein n=1 Tax=Methylobacterium radiodurans TaxID=2202828 RepID=A0A2U8VQ40_9HYPH|nr:hypothetical protein [Methylobacterium radiodurans]AWN35753.1 hypothetical protein DK427_08350 [Methylobacterium radiodurans]
MRLLDYMRDEKLDDEAFASRLGDCTAHAVKKWKYGEREPDAGTIVRIQVATAGKVTVRDWAEQADAMRARRAANTDATPAPAETAGAAA